MKTLFSFFVLACVACLAAGSPMRARAADFTIHRVVESAWAPLRNFMNSLEHIDVKQVKQNIPFRVPSFDFQSRSGIADAPSRITLGFRAVLSFLEGIAGMVAGIISAILNVILSIIKSILSIIVT